MKIAITTGDADGIGSEVCAKALEAIGPQEGLQFFVFRAPECPHEHLNLIDSQFERQTVETPEELTNCNFSSKVVVDINWAVNPAAWVEYSINNCLKGDFHALVTGPLSKAAMIDGGYNYLGHTQMLKKLCNKPNLFMAFLGHHFNVLLLTDHVPLLQLSEHLNLSTYRSSVEACKLLLELLPSSQSVLPIGLLGLNPHAGEQGLIGEFELQILEEFGELLRSNDLNFKGPLVPDAAFFENEWENHSFYYCHYHDQGLIPFKMAHGHNNACQITMGLPFVRTSVDHGTAKNLFNKNLANPNSMIYAIEQAIRIAKKVR